MLRNQVFVLDHMYMSLFSTLRVDPAARRDDRAAGVDSSGAGAAGGVRAADGAHLDVAARRRARGAGARRAVAAASRATCSRPRRPRRPARKCASPASASGWSADAAQRGSAGTARCRRPAGHRRCGTRWRGRCSARAYVGGGRVRRVGLRAPAGRRAAGAGGRSAAVRLHRRDGRRDRIPARHLDGRLAASRLARGLRRVARRVGATCRCPTRCTTGIRFDARVVRLSGHRAPRARRRVARAAGRRGRRDRRRERRRQDDAGEAAGARCTSRRPGAILVDDTPLGAHARRRVARAAGRRVPGFLPLRVPGAAHRRRRRRAAARRRAGRVSARSIAPAPTTSSSG